MENNSGLISKIKNRITSIFKPKPKTYLLGDGKPLEIDGSISNPRNPISTFFNSIGTGLVDFTSSIKKYIDDSKIKNTPTIHSTSLVEPNTKVAPKEAPGLLAQGNLETNHIIPHNIKKEPSSTPKPSILAFEKKEPKVYTAVMAFKGHSISASADMHYDANKTMLKEAITSYRGTIIKEPYIPSGKEK